MLQTSRYAEAIRVRDRDGVPSVEVNGDLDLSDLRTLEAALEQAHQSPSQDVVVSLAETTHCNSGVIRLIIRLADRLARENRRLLLVAPRERVPRRLLEIVYFSSDLLPFESAEEAYAAIAGAGPRTSDG